MKAQPCEVSTYAKSRKDIGVSDPTPNSFPTLPTPGPCPHSLPHKTFPDKALPFSPKVQSHVWVRGGCDSGRCDRCQKKIRIYHSLTGLHCVWCHLEVGSGAVFAPPRPAQPRPARPAQSQAETRAPHVSNCHSHSCSRGLSFLSGLSG